MSDLNIDLSEQVRNRNELGADKYDSDTLMSFQEWKDAGFWVLKGSKCRERDPNGVPQFSKDQTTAHNDPKLERRIKKFLARWHDPFDTLFEPDIF